MIEVHIWAQDRVGKEINWTTQVNGDLESAKEYFLDKPFNMGNGECDYIVIPHHVTQVHTNTEAS